MFKVKLKAFLVHLCISLAIFFGVLYFILFQWYPVPFFTSDGGWYGIRVIAGVDLVLGPLLTLIVYKPKKPGLKFDLTVIGMIQAGALIWGVWFVHAERPIAAVFAEGYFLSVKAPVFEKKDLTGQKLNKFGNRTPVWIYSKLPEDFDEIQELRATAFRLGTPIHHFDEYYTPIGKEEIKKIVSHSLDMKTFLAGKPADLKKFYQFVNKHEKIKDKLVFYTWRARFKYKVVALRSDNLEYVGTLEIKPPHANEMDKLKRKD